MALRAGAPLAIVAEEESRRDFTQKLGAASWVRLNIDFPEQFTIGHYAIGLC
jgi:hypothetical protein